MKVITRNAARVILVLFLGLLLVIAATAAMASETGKRHTGMPLMEGFKTPTELAALVGSSLKIDATGNRVLDSRRCKATGSCATARDYFVGIRAAHPEAHLGSILEVPQYLRSLKKQPAPRGEWYMSRLLVRGDSHRYDAAGWHRAFFKGEAVWYDVNTGEPILAGACGNVVGKRYVPRHVATSVPPSSCATVAFAVKPGEEVRFSVLAQRRLPASACWQLCDGNACSALPSPCDVCDWIGPKSVIPAGFEPLHTGRYTAHAERQTLRFPREVEANYVALCVTSDKLGESDSWIVQPSAWRGVSIVSIPYGGQQWPAWGKDKVDMSRWKK